MASIFSELWTFMRVRKRYWLLPGVIVVLLLGVLSVFSESSPVAPFIYEIF